MNESMYFLLKIEIFQPVIRSNLPLQKVEQHVYIQCGWVFRPLPDARWESEG